MKVTAVFALLPMALAAPSQLNEPNGISKFKRDLPNLTPVNVPNLDTDWDIKCGKNTVKGKQIHLAVSWGTCLQRAGETVGTNNYPHKFWNDEGFKFHESRCNVATHRIEFPIISSGVFMGNNDDEPGKWRAIYVHDSASQTDSEGNPTAYYCGTVYHKNNGNDFIGCDIKP